MFIFRQQRQIPTELSKGQGPVDVLSRAVSFIEQRLRIRHYRFCHHSHALSPISLGRTTIGRRAPQSTNKAAGAVYAAFSASYDARAAYPPRLSQGLGALSCEFLPKMPGGRKRTRIERRAAISALPGNGLQAPHSACFLPGDTARQGCSTKRFLLTPPYRR
jgi:hypothetical protein